jgi:hypothetical protein
LGVIAFSSAALTTKEEFLLAYPVGVNTRKREKQYVASKRDKKEWRERGKERESRGEE